MTTSFFHDRIRTWGIAMGMMLWTVPALSADTNTLTLSDALATTIRHNPTLAAAAHAVRGAEALTQQARTWPNPTLEFEVEEFDRNGAGFDSAETALVLGQEIELGGKRTWRIRQAETERELSRWDQDATRLDLLAETTRLFIEVATAQQQRQLAAAAVTLAEQTHQAVTDRIAAGKESPLQALKSDAELALAQLALTEQTSRLAAARNRLTAMWGDYDPHFTHAATLPRPTESVPSLATLQPRIEANPDWARWSSESQHRHAALSAAKADRVPNLEGSAGYLQYEEDGTDAWVFGIGLPLPLFDRNGGNIAAARHAIAQGESEQAAATRALMADLESQYAALTVAHANVVTRQTKVLPAMEQTYEAACEGYRLGKIDFLDMLDAQRSLFATRRTLTDAVHRYYITLTEIRRLTGTTLDIATQTEGAPTP